MELAPHRVGLFAGRLVWLTLAITAGLVTSGCRGLLGGGEVVRTVGGETRRGIFVSPYSYEHFLLGELAYTAGRWRRAAEEFRAARAGPEDDPLLIARLADCLDRLDRQDAALEVLAQGEALDPESELLHLARGRIHARRGRTDEARDAFARAAAVAPTSESGPLELSALIRAEHPEEADAVLERYLTRTRGIGASPGPARARLRLAVERGDGTAAGEAVHQLLEVAPARAQEVRMAAQTALDAGRPELASRLVRALPPSDADRTLRLAAALASGNRDDAEAILSAWMPSGPSEQVQVADGYRAIGDDARAVELARVAIAEGAGADAQLALARALRAAGRHSDAATRLAAVDPGSQAWPAAPIELAATLSDAGAPALAAEVLAHSAMRRGDPELTRALGEARAEAGDVDGALALLSGDGARAIAARARVLEAGGRSADDLYRTLPVDDIRLGERERVRARAERRWAAGEHDDAIAALVEWTRRAPEDERALARLARMRASED